MESEATRLLTAALDGLAARHRAIAANIANQNTPGYQRVIVRFEDQLEAARKSGRIQPEIDRDRETPGGPDGNNVDAMGEISQLTRVELSYQALTRALSLEASQMRAAISGRM
jgi:flagellar basal-body rod protein FlgB